MKKFTSIVIALAFVMGSVAAQANCQYDVVGTTSNSGGWTFSPDGQVTYGMASWWEDDVYACYNTYRYPQYYQYFSACDFDGSGAVDWQEVLDIYYFVTNYPTGGTPAYAYDCSGPTGYPCPANMPAYYDPAPVHEYTSVEWTANAVCGEFISENGSGDLACTQAETNEFLGNINWILTNHDFTNAVFDAQSGGHQGFARSPNSMLCNSGAGLFPGGFFDDIAECWHGAPQNPGSLVFRFDWSVNYYAALAAYQDYIQQTYPGGSCELDGYMGAPKGFHAEDQGNGWKYWTVDSTEHCDFYGCRCDATITLWSNGTDYYVDQITNNSIFYMYQGMTCEDQRFNF